MPYNIYSINFDHPNFVGSFCELWVGDNYQHPCEDSAQTSKIVGLTDPSIFRLSENQ
jgi:hypothetical protein